MRCVRSHAGRAGRAFAPVIFRLACAAATLAHVGQAARADVALERHADRIDVSIDGQPFTSLLHAGRTKPILFPIIGPTGQGMTRQWPMVEDVPGEPHDHPHHESLWFTHGLVNGLDFWASHPKAGKPALQHGPRQEQVEVLCCESGSSGVVETRNRWCAADGTVICTDTRRIEFAGDAAARTIDYRVTIHADHGPVTFGDTKEGVFGLRVHPALQLKDVHGSRGAAGRIVNAAGERDAAAWGKPARWVDYSGPIAGQTVGIAICDHPDNLRHPTRWHARDYGLFAANPFGLHDFAGEPRGAGDHVLPAGGSLQFRYLAVFHVGDAEAAGIEERWRRWTADAKAPQP